MLRAILYNYSQLHHQLYVGQEPEVRVCAEQCWEWFCIIIDDLFTNYTSDKNQKLESVLNDAESDYDAVYVTALSMMYHRVTGSYCELLGFKTHNLGFYQYVTELQALLEEWMPDASITLMENLPPLFEQPMPNALDQAAVSVLEGAKEKDVVAQKLSSNFSVVLVVWSSLLLLRMQGRWQHTVTGPELGQKLAQSQITNLLGASVDLNLISISATHNRPLKLGGNAMNLLWHI